MYEYSIQYIGYDECIVYVIRVKHEKLFTESEIRTIIEESILISMEEQFEKNKYANTAEVTPKEILKYLQTKGFEEHKEFMIFNFDNICYENEKLKQWDLREDIREPNFIRASHTKPKYLQGE